MNDTIPQKGKRYNLLARPWSNAYLDIVENEAGEWLYIGQDKEGKVRKEKEDVQKD